MADSPRSKAEIAEMLTKMGEAFKVKSAAVADPMLLQCSAAGLFPFHPGAHGPDRKLGQDSAAVYPDQGQSGADVR